MLEGGWKATIHNIYIYSVCTSIAIVLHMSHYIYIVLYYYICAYYEILFFENGTSNGT